MPSLPARSSDQLIHRVALKIRQSLDLDEILNNAATEVRQLLQTDRVLLYRIDTDENGAIIAGKVVVESVGSAWPVILGEVILDPCFASGWHEQYRQGRVSAIADIHAKTIQPCHAEMLAQFSVQANLVVPILQTSDHWQTADHWQTLDPEEARPEASDSDSTDHLWGLLIAHHCSNPRHWTEAEQATLRHLATHLAIAIQQAEQYQQLQLELQERQQTEAALRQSQQDYQTLVKTLEDRVERRSRELVQQSQKANLFAEIALRIRQSLRLQNILQATVSEVQDCLGADRVLIYQVFADGTGKTISEAVVEGYPEILEMTFPEEVFPEDYRERYRRGRVAAIGDVHATDMPLTDCLVEFVEQWAVRAKLIVPILQSSHAEPGTDEAPVHLWGLLIAHQCSAPRQWSNFETELCRSLADQVGVAIAQADFTQALEERVQERTTQLTQSLQATAASEEKFRQLAENIREVFFLKSADAQQLFYISPAYESIFGLSCDSLYEEPDAWFKVVHPDDLARVQQHLHTQRENLEQTVSVEYRIVRPDGTMRWILSRLFPIREKSGEIQRIAGIAEDISERKRTEEAFKRTNVSRSLVGDILRDLQSTSQLSPTAMFQAGQALAERLPLTSLAEYLETFSLMGLGSLELDSSSDRGWRFHGNQLVEVKTGSHSPTCHYARGFLCGAIVKVEVGGEARAGSHVKAEQPNTPFRRQAAAVEMGCCSMGDEQCQFIVQLVEG